MEMLYYPPTLNSDGRDNLEPPVLFSSPARDSPWLFGDYFVDGWRRNGSLTVTTDILLQALTFRGRGEILKRLSSGPVLLGALAPFSTTYIREHLQAPPGEMVLLDIQHVRAMGLQAKDEALVGSIVAALTEPDATVSFMRRFSAVRERCDQLQRRLFPVTRPTQPPGELDQFIANYPATARAIVQLPLILSLKDKVIPERLGTIGLAVDHLLCKAQKDLVRRYEPSFRSHAYLELLDAARLMYPLAATFGPRSEYDALVQTAYVIGNAIQVTGSPRVGSTWTPGPVALYVLHESDRPTPTQQNLLHLRAWNPPLLDANRQQASLQVKKMLRQNPLATDPEAAQVLVTAYAQDAPGEADRQRGPSYFWRTRRLMARAAYLDHLTARSLFNAAVRSVELDWTEATGSTEGFKPAPATKSLSASLVQLLTSAEEKLQAMHPTYQTAIRDFVPPRERHRQRLVRTVKPTAPTKTPV